MIIYYAVSTYHVECCVLHRLTKEPNEKAILLISDIHVNSVLFLQQYRNIGIFDEIILLSEMEVRKYSLYLEQKKIDPMKVVNKCCNRMKKAIPLKLTDARILYMCLDSLPFGWYVVKNKIQHVLFEDGSGILSDRSLFMSTLKPGSVRHRLIDVMGLLGENPYAVTILADTQTQKDGYKNPKMEDFSAKRILARMDNETRQKVMDFFNCPEKLPDVEEKKISLILTQHLANLGIMTLEQQHRLYLLLADYFLKNQTIIIKPHPDDLAGRYKEIFGENMPVLPFAMPSELLPYCITDRFSTVLAASSTAAKSFNDIAEKTLWFDPRIHSDYAYIHRYNIAVLVLGKLLQEKAKIKTNANELLLNALSVQNGNELIYEHTQNFSNKSTSTCFVISDNLELEQLTSLLEVLPDSMVAVFLNENERHLYFNGENTDVFAYIRPIVIKKVGSNEPEEVIYVYTKNSDILNKVEDYGVEIPLPYCGITIDACGIGKDERMKIYMLSGMLEATEKRLCDYIEMKKQSDAVQLNMKVKRKKA